MTTSVILPREVKMKDRLRIMGVVRQTTNHRKLMKHRGLLLVYKRLAAKVALQRRREQVRNSQFEL